MSEVTWQKDPEFIGAIHAEHAIVGDYELLVFDLPADGAGSAVTSAVEFSRSTSVPDVPMSRGFLGRSTWTKLRGRSTVGFSMLLNSARFIPPGPLL
jgi:hypothetical protein